VLVDEDDEGIYQGTALTEAFWQTRLMIDPETSGWVQFHHDNLD